MFTLHLTNSLFFVFSCISHILLFMIIDYVLSSWNFNCFILRVDPQRDIEEKMQSILYSYIILKSSVWVNALRYGETIVSFTSLKTSPMILFSLINNKMIPLQNRLIVFKSSFSSYFFSISLILESNMPIIVLIMKYTYISFSLLCIDHST